MASAARPERLIAELGLVPHPEGGHYREVFRSRDAVERDGARRPAVTSIYYLLRAGELSRWHVVELDEVYHFHEGDALELLTFDPAEGQVRRIELGSADGERRPLHVVPRGVWQASRPLGAYSLVGCTVAPGFDFADFRFVADLPGHERHFDGPLADYGALL
jgi:predicted cupin superfamily sugar epimerase